MLDKREVAVPRLGLFMLDKREVAVPRLGLFMLDKERLQFHASASLC